MIVGFDARHRSDRVRRATPPRCWPPPGSPSTWPTGRAHAGAGVRRDATWVLRRRAGHRQPQPAPRQRLQGVPRRRRADRPAVRRRDRGARSTPSGRWRPCRGPPTTTRASCRAGDDLVDAYVAGARGASPVAPGRPGDVRHRLHAAARRRARRAASRCSRGAGFAAARRSCPSRRDARPRLPDRGVPQPRGAGRPRPRARPGGRPMAPTWSSPTTPTPTGWRSPCPSRRIGRRLAGAHRRRDRRPAGRLAARARRTAPTGWWSRPSCRRRCSAGWPPPGAWPTPRR